MITKNITIKSTILIVVTMLFAVVTNAQIEMNSSGKVGIGTTPSSSFSLKTGSLYSSSAQWGSGSYPYMTLKSISYEYRLEPSTTNSCYLGTSSKAFRHVYAWDLHELSDKRKKENIKKLDGALAKIMSLEAVKYDVKKEYSMADAVGIDAKRKAKFEKERKNKIGFLAQDVFEVLPEVVGYDDSTDVYTINYTRIIPVLVQAMQEQQVTIEYLTQQLAKSTNVSKNKSANLGNTIGETANTLSQNAPNPFTEQTSISYILAESVNDAMICIYDMHGTQLKCYPLSLEGSGLITIDGNELVAGMYMYALIADGQLIDTKNMVLTE